MAISLKPQSNTLKYLWFSQVFNEHNLLAMSNVQGYFLPFLLFIQEKNKNRKKFVLSIFLAFFPTEPKCTYFLNFLYFFLFS